MKNFVILIIVLLCYSLLGHAQYLDGLDPSFGNKGVALIEDGKFKLSSEIFDGLLQPDGKIVAMAVQDIVRLNADGSLDNTFGKGGFFADTLRDDTGALLAIPGVYTFFESIALQPDNKILVVGVPTMYRGILMFRLLPDGQLDKSFGKNGVVSKKPNGIMTNSATNVALQSTGKIIVVAATQTDRYQVLVRYESNGKLDSSFGTNGVFINTLAKNSGESDIKVLPDDRMLSIASYYGVAQYLADGALDTSFNHSGFNNLLPAFSDPIAEALAVAKDGKIWLAGSQYSTNYVVAKVKADGTSDSSFDTDGFKEYDWGTKKGARCKDLLFIEDTSLILGGPAPNPDNDLDNFGIIDLKSDGAEDSSFGASGRLITAPLGADTDGARANKFLLQSDKKIIALGRVAADSKGYAVMVRYNKFGRTGLKIYNNYLNKSILVYPNPGNGKLYIDTDMQNLKSIRVNDLKGSVVKVIENPTSKQIDLSGLSGGVYILHLSMEDSSHYAQQIEIF